MEVLVALAIFMISMIALGQLLIISGDRAFEVQQQSHAAQLCQSKLAEVVSGVVPLSSSSDSYDEDSDWQWALEAEQDSTITGLWRVQVKAFRDLSDGSHYESSVSQMVLDPSLRGSTADTLPSPVVGNNPSTGTGSGSSGSGNGTGGSQGGAMAGGSGSGASGMRSGSGAQGGMAGGGGGVAPAPKAPTPKAPAPSATPPKSNTPSIRAPS
jgi:type II secretory pathway pseudopilin PulG